MPNNRELPTPGQLVSYLDRFVHGQTSAKQDLAASIYRHYMALAYRRSGKAEVSDFGKQHVLIMGPTGSGKTYMMKLLAQLLGVPYGIFSAANLVRSGIVGLSPEQMVQTMYVNAKKDISRAQMGIFFIDEIDKIRIGGNRAEDEIGGAMTQNSLLALLDGTRLAFHEDGTHMSGKRNFDTTQSLFICTGAFVGLAEVVRRRLRHAGHIGFGESRGRVAGPAVTDDDAFRQVRTEDLVEYGFIPEFVGRFPARTSVRTLGVDELVSILTDTETSILRKQRAYFSIHGIELVFEEPALRAVAELALQNGTGARGLDLMVLACLDRIDHRLPELAQEGVSRVVVTEDTARRGASPILEAGASRRRGVSLADRLRRIALVSSETARGRPEATDGSEATSENISLEQRARSIAQLNEKLTLMVDPEAQNWWNLWSLNLPTAEHHELLKKMIAEDPPVDPWDIWDAHRSTGDRQPLALFHYALHHRYSGARADRWPELPSAYVHFVLRELRDVLLQVIEVRSGRREELRARKARALELARVVRVGPEIVDDDASGVFRSDSDLEAWDEPDAPPKSPRARKRGRSRPASPSIDGEGDGMLPSP